MTANKWIYLFGELEQAEKHAGDWDGVLGLLGGKGARLAEMFRLGLPVPVGFVITAAAWNAYDSQGRQLPEGLLKQTLDAVRQVERQSGKTFANPQQPLLLSVRSGAKYSMPGMMDSILNVGLNDKTVGGLVQLTGDQRFGYDTYRRLIQMFSKSVFGLGAAEFEEVLGRYRDRRGIQSDTGLGARDLEDITDEFKAIVRREIGRAFPQDPYEQLRMAIEAVLNSWNNERAVKYREEHEISQSMGTAVTIQMMIFGNMGAECASGVAFSRNQITGKKELYGEYLLDAQGEDLVSGLRTPLPIQQLSQDIPRAYKELLWIARRLERHYQAVQDIEFTIERGKLWILQTRDARPGSPEAVKIAVHMVKEGLISKEDAVRRVPFHDLDDLSQPRFDPDAKQRALASGRLLAKGIAASPGTASGQVVFDGQTARIWGQQGKSVILVRPQARPEDVDGIFWADGVVACKGGASSHAAVIARALDRPCVVGCDALQLDLARRAFAVGTRMVNQSEVVSIDGGTGEVFLGTIETVAPQDFPELREFRSWYRFRSAWVNAVASRHSQRVRALHSKAMKIMAHSRWVTEKAKVVELLGKMIPEQFLIRQIVVDAHDREKLRDTMLDAIRRGYWTGPRSCYYPDPELGKARWQMAIRTTEEIEAFLTCAEFRLGTADQNKGSKGSGGYPTWLGDERLKEIIVPYDPQKKGLPEYEHEHFVFTVSSRANPASVLVELNLGTAQLRSLESANLSELIQITMLLEPHRPDLSGGRMFSFGQRLFVPSKLGVIAIAMNQALDYLRRNGFDVDSQMRGRAFEEFIDHSEQLDDKRAREILGQIYAIDPHVQQFDQQLLASRISEAMRNLTFTLDMCEGLVTPKALRIARAVSETVFDEWWNPPFQFPLVMQALDEAVGLHTLEVQGHNDPDGRVDYALIYGAKGLEESSVSARARPK